MGAFGRTEKLDYLLIVRPLSFAMQPVANGHRGPTHVGLFAVFLDGSNAMGLPSRHRGKLPNNPEKVIACDGPHDFAIFDHG